MILSFLQKSALLLLATTGFVHAQGDLDPPVGSPGSEMKSLQEVWDRLQELNTHNEELEAQLSALSAGYGQLEVLAEANEEIIRQLRSFAEGMATPPTLYPGLVFTSELVDSAGEIFGTVSTLTPVYDIFGFLTGFEDTVTLPTMVAYSGRQNSLASGGGVTACAYTKGLLNIVEQAFGFPTTVEVATSDLWYSVIGADGNPTGHFPVLLAGETPEQYIDPELVMTPTGTPIIAYRFESGNSADFSSLRVAIGGATVGDWTHQTIPTGGLLYKPGHSPSLAIVSVAAGEPGICYENRSTGELFYSRATRSGSEFVWSTPELVAENAEAPSLAVNVGTIGVSFHDTATGSLGYASRSGGTWTTQIVDSGFATESSLAFNLAGNPVIAYRDQVYDRLKVAEWNGASWQISVVADDIYSAVSGLAPEIAILPSGNIGVACLTNTNYSFSNESYQGQVTYLEREGSEWTRFSIDAPGRVSDLAISAAGRPLVSYYRPFRSVSEYVPEVPEFRQTPIGSIPNPDASPAYTNVKHLPGELRVSVLK